MVDNFNLIKKLLKFESEDDFYFVQILQRKKDNPGVIKGTNNNNRLIKAYYIKSVEQLEKYKEEMIALANIFNARVGINLNKRSFYKTAFNTLKKISEQLHNRNFHNVATAYNTACGVASTDDRIWILDIDSKEISPIMMSFINLECEPIEKHTLFGSPSKILAVLPTKVGYHLITKPFDTREFVKRYPEVEIHRNNPTNLYIP